jgi:phage/plasmid-like protein (TIGR03299 family)
MIDQTTGRDAIAFVGEVPWHGLGQQLTQGASIEEWTREAGLGFEVKRSGVIFRDDAGMPCSFDGRDVLYRSDTKGRLGIVGSDYRVVQPSRLMDFMAALVKHNGFDLDVAGVLDGGKRVWALARCGEGANVIGHDKVRPYVLIATSYDGSMSTIAKFTEIRVVCNNTITAAVGAYNAETGMRSGGERDITDGPVVQCVRIPHSQDFDPESARMDLGIALSAHEEFMIRAQLLAHTPVDEKFVVAFLRELLPKPRAAKREGEQQPPQQEPTVEDTRAFQRLLATWKGDVPSATLPEANGTAWGLLNAVTWDVDHVRGRDGTRLGSAWFGTGEGLKTKALDLLTKIARGERELEQA